MDPMFVPDNEINHPTSDRIIDFLSEDGVNEAAEHIGVTAS